MVDKTTPESSTLGRPSETLILFVGASASDGKDACQILVVRQKCEPFEVILLLIGEPRTTKTP